jgi:O-antigen/teichoic acid export membrane protein
MNRTVAKNTFWLFLGQSAGRALRAGLLIVSARILGASSWGAFSYALSLASFFSMFTDFGINALITREVARKPEVKFKYLSTSLFIKIGLLFILGTIALIFRNQLTKIPEAVALMPLMVAIVAFDSLRDLALSIVRAIERMEIEAWINILTNLAILGFGLFLLLVHPTSYAAMLGYALGSAAGLLAALVALRRDLAGLFEHFSRKLIWPIVKTAWPIGVLGLLGPIMVNADTIIVGWLRSPAEIGFYSAAQRIIQFLYVLPVLLGVAFLPSVSKLVESKEEFRRSLEQAVKAAFFLAFPLAVGGALLAGPLIVAFYGQAYLPAASSFLILCLTFFSLFPAALIINAAFALDRQKSFIFYSVIAILANIVLDIVFIPIWGIAGSALATLLVQIFMFIYVIGVMRKIDHFDFFQGLKKIATSSLLMAGFIILARRIGLDFWLVLILAGSVYFGSLALLKEPLLKTFLSYFRKRAQPFSEEF